MSEVKSVPAEPRTGGSRLWLWLLFFGTLQLALGIVGLGHTIIVGLLVVAFIGLLLVYGAGVQVAEAVMSRGFGATVYYLLLALLYAGIGSLFILYPELGGEYILLTLAFFLFAGGLFRVIGSVFARYPGWGIALFTGLINIALGVVLYMFGALMYKEWPLVAEQLIGICVSIDLILNGLSWIMSALFFHDIEKAR
jgi:uncharacterized membrane protein HdeD (DUF308 family)